MSEIALNDKVSQTLIVNCMKKVVTILLAILWTNSFSNAQIWTQFTDSFANTYVSVMYKKESTICVGKEDGLFCSSNYGKTWKFKIRTQVNSFTADSNYIYAGTMHGFYRSSDYGNTWENTMNEPVHSITHIDSSIFLLHSQGIFVSTNQGLEWEVRKSNLNASFNSIDKFEDALYVGTVAGIYMSFDTGKTWEFKNAGLADLMVTSVTEKNSIMFAGTLGIISGYNSGVYMSSNRGENWSKITPDMTVAVTTLESHGSMMFAGTLGNGVYVSTDLGIHWNLLNEGLNSLYVGHLSIQGDTLYATTGSGIMKTAISKINVKKDIASIDENRRIVDRNNNWVILNSEIEQMKITRPPALLNSTERIHYKIYSLNGIVIYSTVNQNDSFTIPIENFSNGLYTIIANSGAEIVTSTFSIIK